MSDCLVLWRWCWRMCASSFEGDQAAALPQATQSGLGFGLWRIPQVLDQLDSNTKFVSKCFLLLCTGVSTGLSRGGIVEALDRLVFASGACRTAAIALKAVSAKSPAI